LLGSVQLYVKSIIDGLPMPRGIPAPLTVRITPPMVEKVSGPMAYVWGGRLRAALQSAPRGPALKRFNWTVDVTLGWLDTPDNALRNEPFPRVIDAVMWAFMTTTMPVWIDVDGVVRDSGVASVRTDTQIQAIGETFDLDYPPERAVTPQRQVWYTARLGLDVLEVLQA
jgi:hypothetical protein